LLHKTIAQQRTYNTSVLFAFKLQIVFVESVY